MLQRVLVAVIFVPLIFLVLFFLPPIAIPIAISILSMLAVHEVLWSTGFVRNAKLSGYSIVLSGLIPFWIFSGQGTVPALCALFVYFTLVFVEAISSHYTVTMEKMGGAFFFATLIPYFLSSFTRLDQMEGGKIIIITPLVAAFLSDTFALFAGMLFGRHKLAPQLSPKKTVEGSLGGALGAMLSMLVYGVLMRVCFQQLSVNFPLLALYGLLGSAAAQLGDLSFSYIKRQYQLKDFGSILPGHGGILDRFDSVIFCAPLIEILWRLLPAIQFS